MTSLNLLYWLFGGGVISEVKDFRTDLNPKGIGYDQFEGSKNEIDKWLKKVSQPETDLSFLPTITGYSLGGALAQWVAASHQGSLGKIVTFNSPGISHQPGINLLATNNLGVTHYRAPRKIANHKQFPFKSQSRLISLQSVYFQDFLDCANHLDFSRCPT
jgi:hypothetical protein